MHLARFPRRRYTEGWTPLHKLERLTKLLQRAPEISAAAEFVVHRCYYHPEGAADSETGYCITFYLHGYGDDEDEARRRWNVGLKLVENALVQLSAQQRRQQQEQL